MYRTSPETVNTVAKTLQNINRPTTKASRTASTVQHGRYVIEKDKIYTSMRYENSTATEIRSRLKLRSTCPGANNRLDIESIFSWDREDGRAMPMADIRSEDDDAVDDGVEQRRYNRGMSPYVFLSWESVNSSELNLPVTQMDLYIPG